MTRNTRLQLAEDAERWIRAWSRKDVSREDAAVMVTYWHLYEPADSELVAEVLSRFSPAEPPAVPGVDYLPDLEFVNCHPESDLPPCWHASDEPGYGPLVEVRPDVGVQR